MIDQNILKTLKESYEEVEGNEEQGDKEGDAEVERDEENVGDRIKCLPGDKKGLTERLRLLLAEREAGNIVSTTQEIVGILDALLQMGEISHQQYNAICKTLQC